MTTISVADVVNRLQRFRDKFRMTCSKSTTERAFTIVELLIVIVIIGILATIVIVAYNGITTKARQATLQSDLTNSRSKLEIANATDGSYPAKTTVDANKSNYLAESKGNTLTYNTNSNQDTYCISAIGPDNITYVISNLAGPFTGSCTGTSSEVATQGSGIAPTVTYIQTITTATCPATRTRVADARDNHSYWIQKLADGKCWMLTNLAYAGGTSNGGANTYSDVIPVGDGSTGTLNGPDNAGSATYTLAKYYIPTGSNVTTEPTNPSTSTNGTGQYGYLYNWCAAMGAQATAACANATTPAPVTTTSICPKNWRLPTSNGGEFTALTTAINATNDSAGSTNLRSTWLAQYGGAWSAGFGNQGTSGNFWSSTQYSSSDNAYMLSGYSTNLYPDNFDTKYVGFSVRCLAAV